MSVDPARASPTSVAAASWSMPSSSTLPTSRCAEPLRPLRPLARERVPQIRDTGKPRPSVALARGRQACLRGSRTHRARACRARRTARRRGRRPRRRFPPPRRPAGRRARSPSRSPGRGASGEAPPRTSPRLLSRACRRGSRGSPPAAATRQAPLASLRTAWAARGRRPRTRRRRESRARPHS